MLAWIEGYGDYVRRAISGLPSRSSTSSIQSDDEPEVTSAAPSKESEIPAAHIQGTPGFPS